ncbi:MAG: zf-HC2 domain-containing protein [Candidatus Aegiribacteria sp.]|nr:zf-HC2 domain-containing protein [Candidatus Aegiribacteria sp.]
MNCSRALKLISLVIDGEATEQQKRLLDFHLMGCDSCKNALLMSKDISIQTRDLPAPVPPENLEDMVREMISRTQNTHQSRFKFRRIFLAAPAVAALLILSITLIPVSNAPESILDIGMTDLIHFTSKSDQVHMISKSRIRTAPLSVYSRQASLISF